MGFVGANVYTHIRTHINKDKHNNNYLMSNPEALYGNAPESPLYTPYMCSPVCYYMVWYEGRWVWCLGEDGCGVRKEDGCSVRKENGCGVKREDGCGMRRDDRCGADGRWV